MTAENPNWRALACDPVDAAIESRAATNQPRRLER